MRLARIVGALVALVMTVTMGQSLISPADAAAKPKHDLHAKGKEIGNNKFYVVGKVATFPRGKITIMRKVAGGQYSKYKKVKTKASGKFRARIFQVGHKKTFFKVVVPATSAYKKTQLVIGYIYSV